MNGGQTHASVTVVFIFPDVCSHSMRLRALFLALGLPLASLPAFACNMDLLQRGAAVADYVETVLPCLSTLPEGHEFDQRMELEFLDLINQARAFEGLAPVALRAELRDAARFHSLDMAYNDFFGHDGPDGRNPKDRILAFDRRALFKYSSENVAMIEAIRGRWDFERKAVPRLHGNLMDSPSHRANILSPKATHVALGVVQTKTGVWVTQLFMDLSANLPGDMPLRLQAGQAILERPEIAGWMFHGYELHTTDGTYIPIGRGVPRTVKGEAELAAHARQPGDSPGKFYVIRFMGPAVTVGG